jgi:hypothetical protein
VVLAFLLLAALTSAPYLRAWLSPPPGTAFLGFFYFVDDSYNYLSYAEQAERGGFLFENKLAPRPRQKAMINLEWWSIGRLSAALGGRPFLAYRLLALLAGFLLVVGIDRWLRAVGLPETHRLVALLLVGLGAGLGGLAWRVGLVPLSEAPDLTTGMFPFVELLANPHFVVGTALLSWSGLAFSNPGHRLRDYGLSAILGTTLGLVRPYELALLMGGRLLAVTASLPPREWLGGMLPLAGLAPALGYNAWLFFGAGFASFSLTYKQPSALAFALALGPAMALAAASFVVPASSTPRRGARSFLLGWVGVGLAIAVLRPVGYPLQFLVGIGVPLLVLGALALSRFRPFVTLLVALGLSGTGASALGLLLSDNPRWYVPPERLAVARVLKTACRPGNIALTPPDVGLYVLGLTACDPFVSHPAAPRHLERESLLKWFLGMAKPAERAAFLDRERVDFVLLPASSAPVPEGVLGTGTPFRALPGGVLETLAVFGREAR